jgi:hypothetical protein
MDTTPERGKSRLRWLFWDDRRKTGRAAGKMQRVAKCQQSSLGRTPPKIVAKAWQSEIIFFAILKMKSRTNINVYAALRVVPRGRLELPTNRLRVCCSTIELPRHDLVRRTKSPRKPILADGEKRGKFFWLRIGTGGCHHHARFPFLNDAPAIVRENARVATA